MPGPEVELLSVAEAIAAADPDLAARALAGAAEAMARDGDGAVRRAALDRAIALGDLETAAASRIARAELARREGRPAEARADLAAAGPLPALASRAARIGALLALDSGDLAEAEQCFDRAIDSAMSDGDRARALAMRFAHRLVLDAPADEADGARAHELHRAAGEPREAAAVLANLGLAALHRGDDARGRDRLARAEEEARASGDRAALAGARLFAGLADLAAGSLAGAIAALAEAEAISIDRSRWSLWSDAVGYGAVARLMAGRPAARAELASHVDELARRGGRPQGRALFAAVLHLVDDARPAPDPALARGRPLIARAIEALAGAPHTYGLPVRVARRARTLLGSRRHPASARRGLLEVSRDRRRFRIDGAEADLTRRGPLGRVFAELVARSGASASADELIAAGWPGEAIQRRHRRARLRDRFQDLSFRPRAGIRYATAMRALAVAIAAALAPGCTGADAPAAGPDAGLSDAEIAGSCPAVPVAIDTRGPIFLFYGAYQPNPGETPRADAASTRALLGTGEPVLALRRAPVCAAREPELQPWQEGGGKVAHVMSEDELLPRLADGTAAAAITSLLHQGYAYVAIDELHAGLGALGDGQWGVAAFVALVDELDAAGLDRRLILYVNSYNLSGQLHGFSQVLAACRDHCRIVASEIYLHTQHVFAPAAESPGHCNRSTGCFERIAAEMGAAAPGINHRTVTVLAISDEFNQARADSLCERPGGLAGALTIQYARLHSGTLTRLQPGAGAYTPARVDRRLHPAWGPAEQAACLRRLDGWSYWPDAH